MSDASVVVESSSPEWQVTLNRPQQGNACSSDLVACLDDVIQKAEYEGARAMIIRGAGRHFCTGFDLSALEEETDDTLLARFVRIELMLQRLARASFVTVAIAHGRAVGAGADIFTACAVRCVVGAASFAFPGARGFGLVLGTRRLSEAVGRRLALAWIESGSSISADEALQAGLATHALSDAVPHDTSVWAGGVDRSVADILRRATSPARQQEDASDLARLIESAAKHGLSERIKDYVRRTTPGQKSFRQHP